MPSGPLSEPEAQPRNPIVDSQDDIDSLLASQRSDKPVDSADTKEDDWREAFTSIVETQKTQMQHQQALQESVTKLAESLASAATAAPSRREPEQAPAPSGKKGWRERVAPGTDEIIQEAFSELYQERKTKDFEPVVGYLYGNLDRLLERELGHKYDDPTFGYEALRDDVVAYRKATGFQVDAETAYQRVAFDAMASAVKGATAEVRRQKRTDIVDEGGRQAPSRPGPEELSSDEKMAAWSFFPDKPRKEAEAIWVENKVAMERERSAEREDR